MNKKQRAQFIQKTLDELYPDPQIPLSHTSNFTLLVAILLSAQCTDARVNSITPLLYAKASTPEQMTRLSIEDIQEIIRPCGLAPTKAKAIYNLSKILVEKYGGEVPSTFEELESLPGVGHKTASALISQAFGVPAFAVDTHIHRCAKRWGLSSGKSVAETEKDLKALYPKESWSKLHLQMIYFGREHCPARGHDASRCPICSRL